MKKIFLFSLLLMYAISFGQEETANTRKGKIYFYWGWNGSKYSKSDIQFKGDTYDFTLQDVVGNDRQSQFGIDPYFNPMRMTIPQYNFRLGYYLNDKWDISIGVDLMKYVVARNQTVKINGTIAGTGTVYDNTYSNDNIVISDDFLFFEHTDGLNYINAEMRYTYNAYQVKKFDFDLIGGAGLGFLYPRTNTTLINKPRYDEFHLAGYGLSILTAGRITFNKKLFVQSEFKTGYINMPNIRTTMDAADVAKQHFMFSQWNIVFGGVINIGKKH